MRKEKVLEQLHEFKIRLMGEVWEAYLSRGRSYGEERFTTWRRKFSQFLDDSLPGQTSILNEKLRHSVHFAQRRESDAERFWRIDGENMVAYIDSLILDIENDEYDFKHEVGHGELAILKSGDMEKKKDKVFIVHGHDGEAKEKTARFIEKLGFEAIILHEKANKGMTIIEKIEEYSNDVAFGIVLYTPDDKGSAKNEAESGNLNYRARQNVVFEHGYLIGKLGRGSVAPLVEGPIELPNDISGIVYISDKDWQVDIAREMKAAGYNIDFNKLM